MQWKERSRKELCTNLSFLNFFQISNILAGFFPEDWYPDGKSNVLPGSTGETVVTGLRPHAVYHLRVFAENQLGKSKEGKVLQVRSNGGDEESHYYYSVRFPLSL